MQIGDGDDDDDEWLVLFHNQTEIPVNADEAGCSRAKVFDTRTLIPALAITESWQEAVRSSLFLNWHMQNYAKPLEITVHGGELFVFGFRF